MTNNHPNQNTMKLQRCNTESCTPTRYSGLSELDRFFRQPFGGLPFFSGEIPSSGQSDKLAADVYADDTNYYAQLEVPGVDKEGVALQLNDQTLTVTVTRKEKLREGEKQTTLTRSFTVPRTVDAGEITAVLNDGVLTVTLPKAEESKPRTISVE